MNDCELMCATSSSLYPVDPASRNPSSHVPYWPTASKKTAARSQSMMSGTAWATLEAISWVLTISVSDVARSNRTWAVLAWWRASSRASAVSSAAAANRA